MLGHAKWAWGPWSPSWYVCVKAELSHVKWIYRSLVAVSFCFTVIKMFSSINEQMSQNYISEL